MTEQEKIQAIAYQIDSLLRRTDERINEYTLEAAKDFIYFFHWNAGNMYEAEMVYKYFKAIKTLPNSGCLAEITQKLECLIAELEDELLNTSPFGTCTNELVNVEHRLRIESKRKIRRELQDLLSIANYKK